MKFNFKSHNYYTAPLGYWLKKFFLEGPYLKSTVSFINHGDGCCNYWTPVDSPKAKRAFMLDDNFGLKEINE